MARTKIWVDFYGVYIGNDRTAFATHLAAVGARPLGRREVYLRGVMFRLEEFEQSNGQYYGDMVRIRMDHVPTRVRSSLPSQPIDLRADEGLGEHNAFIFDTRTQALLLERHRSGVNSTTFGEYFTSASSTHEPVFLRPLIQPDALQRAMQMRSIRKFEVDVAGADASVLRGSSPSANEVLDLAAKYGAPRVSLTFSMGYDRSTSLRAPAVRNLIRNLFGGSSSETLQVTKLRVKGDENDEVAVVDLLADRMVEPAEMPVSDRRVPYGVRKLALQDAFERRRSELGQLVGQL